MDASDLSKGRRRLTAVIARLPLTVSALLLSAFVGGCAGDIDRTEPTRIAVLRGDGQVDRVGAECARPILIKVFGPRVPGMLGGRGEPHPVKGVTVRFEPLDPDSGLTVLGDTEVVTDSGGYASVKVRLGTRFGDQYLRVSVPDSTRRPSATLRFVAGVRIHGGKQETTAGNPLPEPIIIEVTDEECRALPGVPVFFRLVNQPGSKGRLSVTATATDERGMAAVQLETDPEATGGYEIVAEVADTERGYHVRGVPIQAMVINRLGLAIGVFGGLGVFILGMRFMSEGLQRVAGQRLKGFLHFFTRNRVAAVAAGTLITGMIQSSSACTVMVVGFVNAGLLNLQQAIGIIFGANIGTTVTGQMVSFKLDGLALPAISIGVVLALLARRSLTRNLAQTLFGFGLLFLGMTMMSAQLKSISAFPSFIDFFRTFDCQPATPGGAMPLGAVLGAVGIGTALTVLVQSSSATIGLTIALATSGLLNFHTAVPIVLGDNIGTTITAILASIGTNRPARQAALAHTIFNVVGTIFMVALFYVPVAGVPVFLKVVNLVTAGDVFAVIPENIGRHVAAAHTLFNIVNVLVFLPQIALIAWICQHIVPGPEGEAPVCNLEPHLLHTPTLALQQTIRAVVVMTESAWTLLADSYGTLQTLKIPHEDDFVQREERVDQMQHDISQYLVELTRRELSEDEARVVPPLIHCVNDAERIGDHAGNLLEITRAMRQQKLSFSKRARKELTSLFDLVSELAALTVKGLDTGDLDTIQKALKLEGKVNLLTAKCRDNHVRRLGKDECSVAAGITFVDILANLERVADHLSNIAERAGTVQQGV